jgi:hypothetical protein
MTQLAMQGIDVFLDTYVRLDEGTAVLLCAHRTCVRTAAWLYAALALRGAQTETHCFDESDAESSEKDVRNKLAALRARPGIRRVAVIISEPFGPSFRRVLAEAQEAAPERTPVFRIEGPGAGLFEMNFQERAGSRPRARGYADPAMAGAALDDEDGEGFEPWDWGEDGGFHVLA